MLCDKYTKTLIEAAGRGAPLPAAAREHVEGCGHCGSMLAGEQNLFAAVDAGLRHAANAKVRSSFLTKVKANLATQTASSRNPIPAWAFVCATGALALAGAFLSLPRGARDKARPEAIIEPSKAPARVGGVELSLAPERKIGYSARGFMVSEHEDFSRAASHEPEVLIQPQEEEFLKRFYAAGRTPPGDAKVIVTDNHEVTPKPLVIEQIEVRDLSIENLDQELGLAQTDTK